MPDPREAINPDLNQQTRGMLGSSCTTILANDHPQAALKIFTSSPELFAEHNPMSLVCTALATWAKSDSGRRAMGREPARGKRPRPSPPNDPWQLAPSRSRRQRSLREGAWDQQVSLDRGTRRGDLRNARAWGVDGKSFAPGHWPLHAPRRIGVRRSLGIASSPVTSRDFRFPPPLPPPLRLYSLRGVSPIQNPRRAAQGRMGQPDRAAADAQASAPLAAIQNHRQQRTMDQKSIVCRRVLGDRLLGQ